MNVWQRQSLLDFSLGLLACSTGFLCFCKANVLKYKKWKLKKKKEYRSLNIIYKR